MSNKGKLLIVFAVFLVVTCVRLGWHDISGSPQMPVAKQGVLDARGWDFAHNGAMKLNGEWEFYRDGLYTADQLAAQAGQKLTVNVPGVWDAYVNEQSKTSFGYGTYHLTMLLPESSQRVWGVRVANIRSSHRLFIDGQTAGEQGRPSARADDVVARNVPYVTYMEVTGNRLDIVLQIANADFGSGGGIFEPIMVGPLQEIVAAKRSSEYFDAIAGSLLLLFGIYFCMLFIHNSRFTEFIYFSLSNLFAALYLVTHRERIALGWFDLSYDWVTRIQFLSMLGLIITYSLFMKNIARQTSGGKAGSMLLALTGLCIASVLLLNANTFTSLNAFYIFVSWITVMYHFVWLLRSVWSNHASLIWVVISTCSIFYNGVFENLRFLGWIQDDGWVPIEILVFAISLAMLSSERFFSTLTKAEQLSQQLLTLDKAKDEFLANTSHELRTPLHATMNIVQSVVEGGAGELNERQKENLQLVLDVGKRLTHLLDDLLDISHLQAGIELKRTSLAVHDVVAVAMDVMRFLTDEQVVRLVNRVPEQLPRIVADEQRFLQIIFNLLYNAIKFTPVGTITVEAERKGGMVEIRVADTGIGIVTEKQASIFDMFAQGDDGKEGKGLGLHICKKLVERHGGTIRVTSEQGRGTTFFFTMPITGATEEVTSSAVNEQFLRESITHMQTAAAAMPQVPETRQPQREKTEAHILLVDDDPTNRYVMMNLLAAEPYQITIATNGREALAALSQHRRWDLVILDVMLPHMSGYEVCHHLRQLYTPSELPVLMVTARIQKDDLLAGFAAGANDYVTKPVEAFELRARVRTLLRMKQSVSEVIQAEMAFLQSQIKPHFLFNTLNTILAVSQKDVERAQDLLIDLSTYLRNSFDFEQHENVIAIQRELELVEAYLHIEQTRFGDRLHVVCEFPDSPAGQVPPLTIQPIVENAIRHGAMKRLSGGTVKIALYAEDGHLVVTVEDNGPGYSADEALQVADKRNRKGVGLRNIERRLRSIGAGLEIESELGSGTKVTIRIPQTLGA
ncbi:response regulator [Brevibacillus fluminis]|uniref:histidine kinase n=1 Tax=Brevibacillus fluminis TaxID=511487 RepID=A0A3M8DSS5_9BACL|nr:ATP-binding protein [Brevibacillus fluminis]RNB90431.1 response regulator [Brevibacillus fluminis]